MLTDGSAYRHKEELGTKPRVYYLPPRNRQYAPPAVSPDTVKSL
jgi:molybdopterin-containing oxidoreductase family iron-sulfur binding subunit